MREMPEINHCIPNRNAFWCAKCFAHSQFYLESEADGTPRYSCRECGFAMFRPGEVVPWMNGLLFGTLLLGGVGVSLLPHELETYWQWSPVCLAFAGFFGLIGGMMWFYMRKYFQWSLRQSLKSKNALEQEAEVHRYTPHYESSEEFDIWALQFLAQSDLQELHDRFVQSQPSVDKASNDSLQLPPPNY